MGAAGRGQGRSAKSLGLELGQCPHARLESSMRRCTHVKAAKTCWRYAWKSPPVELVEPPAEADALAAADDADDWASAAGVRASAERTAAVYFILGRRRWW